MKAIINGRLLMPEGEIRGKALLYEEKIIGTADPAETAGADVLDAGGAYVAPGLIDTHIHGYRGKDASDGDAEGLLRMAAEITENGVTAFLPTTMTIPFPMLEEAFRSIRRAGMISREKSFAGAEILGCHAEGPFISPDRKGAQAEDAILPPDADAVAAYQDVIRIMTYAPERKGAAEMARRIRENNGIRLSIGHTDADYGETLRAMEEGTGRVTHLFNAMPPMHHRNPGPVCAALTADVYTEVIADGFHIHPGLFPMLHRLKGNRLILITDCVRAGGMPEGEYTLGGQRFTLQGNRCLMEDGTIAGSVLRMNEAVRNYRDYAGIPMAEAVCAASLYPAESIGIADRKGSLLPGKDADIVLMDEDCCVLRTIIRGTTRFRR